MNDRKSDEHDKSEGYLDIGTHDIDLGSYGDLQPAGIEQDWDL